MNRSTPLFLGLDSSTTACKAVIWDGQGNAVAAGSASHPMLTPQSGWYEQPAGAWWQAAVLAIRQAASQVETSRLAALSIAHQRETFVPVDERDHPMTNGILWMDERARDLMAGLLAQVDGVEFQRITGKRLSVNLTFSKIFWLRKNAPEVFAHTRRYLDVHAYLTSKLAGEYATAWGSADPTGLFDLQQNDWSVPLLESIGISTGQLPLLHPPGSVVGRVTESAALECGLPADLPVIAGIGDGQACGLGANITTPGDAYLSLGTSLVSGTHSMKFAHADGFRTMTGGMAGSFLLETVILGGTYTLDWFLQKMAAREGVQLSDLQAEFDRKAGDIPPGSEGLVTVPYWNSVLNPYWDASASGITLGWRGAHNPAHFYRAILEGLAFEQYLGTLGVEEALGQPVKRYIAMGGGARSRLWLQIIADVSGKPVFQAETNEAAALGAGILAAVGAGFFSNAREAAAQMAHVDSQAVDPDPIRHKFYQRLFEEVYRPLYPALKGALNCLAALSEGSEKNV